MKSVLLTLVLLILTNVAFSQDYEKSLERAEGITGTLTSVVYNGDSTGNTAFELRSPSDTTKLLQTPSNTYLNSTSRLTINTDVTVDGTDTLPNLQRNFNVLGKVHFTFENMGFLLEDSTNFMGYPLSGSGVYGTTDTSLLFDGYHRQEDQLGTGVYNHLQRFYLDTNFFYIGNTLSPIETSMFIKNDQRQNGPTVGLSVERDPLAIGPDSVKYKARLYTNISPGVGNGELKINPIGFLTSTAPSDTGNHILFRNSSQDTLLQLSNNGNLRHRGTYTIFDNSGGVYDSVNIYIANDTLFLDGSVQAIVTPDKIAYGEMGFGDSTSTLAITQDTWVIATNGNQDLWAEGAISNFNITYSNDSIIINTPGVYSIHSLLTLDGTNTSTLTSGIFLNGSLTCTCTQYHTLRNNIAVPISYIDALYLDEGDVLQVVVKNTESDDDVDAVSGKLLVRKID